MKNITKLALASMASLMLSTSVFAEDLAMDILEPIKAGTIHNNSVLSEPFFKGTTFVAEKVNITFDFTGEPSHSLSSTVPTTLVFHRHDDNNTDNDMTVNLTSIKDTDFDSSGDAHFTVKNADYDIVGTQVSGIYDATVTVALDY